MTKNANEEQKILTTFAHKLQKLYIANLNNQTKPHLFYMKRLFAIIATVILQASLFCLHTLALDLPDIIGSDMMLQQRTDAKIWGWAKARSTVEVQPSWDMKIYKATAASDGRWEVKVKTPYASYDTHSITIKGDGETRVIKNVLIGEVWFCSGQSNMEMPIGGFWNCPVEGANEAIATANKYKKSIRCATIEHTGADTPQLKAKGGWKVCNTANVSSFSACGYFFARTLTEILDVPVGIINCSWGGSCVEGWLPKDILLTYPDGLTPMDDADYHKKMIMYNGMLHPLAGYTIKGFLWNQGESNVGREKEYIDRFITMTNLWRKMWDQPGDKLPMYTVELPPYDYGDINGDWGAKFREAQHTIAHTLENSGCVCTSDLIYDYEPTQVHGTKKLEIGQRLAYMAATRDYNIKGIAAEAPEFDHMKTVDANSGELEVIAGTAVAQKRPSKGKVTYLYFKNGNDGFSRLDNIQGFEAAGADGKFYPAVVWAGSDSQGCLLKLVCPKVADVKHVRYCFKNFIPGKLHGMRGLPVVPFRTDNF